MRIVGLRCSAAGVTGLIVGMTVSVSACTRACTCDESSCHSGGRPGDDDSQEMCRVYYLHCECVWNSEHQGVHGAGGIYIHLYVDLITVYTTAPMMDIQE